jgi:hypothetical protein
MITAAAAETAYLQFVRRNTEIMTFNIQCLELRIKFIL